jgi:hypothetical protein
MVNLGYHLMPKISLGGSIENIAPEHAAVFLFQKIIQSVTRILSLNGTVLECTAYDPMSLPSAERPDLRPSLEEVFLAFSCRPIVAVRGDDIVVSAVCSEAATMDIEQGS